MLTLSPLIERVRVLNVELRELQVHLDQLRALRAISAQVDLRKLHRQLIGLCHPDRGGSTALSQDVNKLFGALLSTAPK